MMMMMALRTLLSITRSATSAAIIRDQNEETAERANQLERGETKPSFTCAEACTILLALFHARRNLHPNNTYSTLTDSLSSVYGWDKSGLPRTARANLETLIMPNFTAAFRALSWRSTATPATEHTRSISSWAGH